MSKYISIDLEATGLDQNDLIIEFAAVPVCSESRKVDHANSFHTYIECPSFEELLPNLNPWVAEHNKELIIKSHEEGISLDNFNNQFFDYLKSSELNDYINKDRKFVLLGKSLNAIDLPFLNRDLGWQQMRDHFSHQVLDVSGFVRSLIDSKKIPDECIKGSELALFLEMGEVKHTALEDAVQTAEIYFKLLDLLSDK